MPAARSDWESIQVVVAKRRRPGLRAAIAAVMLVALAVPAYLAYQYPAQFREQLDAITSRFEGALVTQLPTSQPLPTSPQLPVLADNPASPQRETVPLPQDAAISSSATVVATGEAQSQPPDLARDAQLPSVDAGRAMQSPPDGTTREPSGQLPDVAALSRSASGEPQSPSPAVVGESAIPVPEARTAPRSQAARNARSNAVRSTAARSKQGGVARTVAAPKASDARTRARSSEARRSEARERAGR